jgi:hypothetical protein
MSLLPPEALAVRAMRDNGLNILEDEVLAEKAASLGHHGRQVERTLAALRAFDAAGGPAEERMALVRAAAKAVWAFLVQRELCGLRDQKEMISFYRIPGEVIVRLGVIEPAQK